MTSGRRYCLHLTSHVSCLASYISSLPLTSYIHLTSHILHFTFHILHLTFHIWHLTSYILHLTSYILHRISYILHLTSYLLPLTSYLLHLTFHILPLTGYLWQEVTVESKEKCKREEKTLKATIERGCVFNIFYMHTYVHTHIYTHTHTCADSYISAQGHHPAQVLVQSNSMCILTHAYLYVSAQVYHRARVSFLLGHLFVFTFPHQVRQ